MAIGNNGNNDKNGKVTESTSVEIEAMVDREGDLIFDFSNVGFIDQQRR